MPEWLDKLQTRLGMGDEEAANNETSLLSQFNEATTLSRMERLIGFACCFGMGLLLSFLSPMFIVRPTKFALIYTLGNLLSIGSSLFLMGPWTQLKRMFQPARLLSTSIYLASMVLTLVAALALHSVLLCLLCLVVQFAAFLWYCLSYIPFGQSTVLRAFGVQLADEAGT